MKEVLVPILFFFLFLLLPYIVVLTASGSHGAAISQNEKPGRLSGVEAQNVARSDIATAPNRGGELLDRGALIEGQIVRP